MDIYLNFNLNLHNMNYFICITTIQKYKVALDMLIESLPIEWKTNYILVYQDEEENNYKIFEDGHIEVYITNNLSDYGSFVGINMLLEANVVPQDSWFLLIHDTCKFLGDSCVSKIYNLIEQYNNSDIDILWLSKNGQCNICLIRKKAIQVGNECYKNIKYMTKMETICYEWTFTNPLSPKSFDVKQHFINGGVKDLGKRYMYNNKNGRICLLFQAINMEKYYFFTSRESDHPFSP